MYKVCFNENDQIIGFNIDTCFSYINLFSITDVKKTIMEDKFVEKLDSFGRNVFLKKHKETGETVNVSLMNNENYFEDELFEYTKQYKTMKDNKVIYLVDESDKFTLEDIVEIKKEQLKKHYECSSCELYEFFNNIEGSNYICGKNFVRINENSNLSLNKLKCKKNSNIIIHCETDNDIKVFLNSKEVSMSEFFKTTSENIKVSFKGNNEVNIYSIGILFK